MLNKNAKSNISWPWLPTKAIIIYNGKTDWDPIADFKKKGYALFNGNNLPFECVMVNLANILDSDCKGSENPEAAIGALVMKHAYDPDGLRNAGEIIKELLNKLDNNAKTTLAKKIELYLKWYIDQDLVKEMIMAFKSIGQRMGFVSIADAEMKAEASGIRKGVQKERANSEKTLKIWAQRVSKKTGMSEEELLALKP